MDFDRPIDVELAPHRKTGDVHVEQNLGAAGRVAAARANRFENRLARTGRTNDRRQPGSKRVALSAFAVMPKEPVAVRVRDETKAQTCVEQRLGKLVVELPTVPERMIGVLVAAVARADLPNRLPFWVVSGNVGAGPTDVVRPRERTLRADLLDDVPPLGNVVARDDREARARKVNALVPRPRIRLAGPFVRNDRGELAGLVVPFGHGLQVGPLARPDSFPEE